MGLGSQRASWVLAVIGAGVAAGIVAGLSPDPQQLRSESSPAEMVATRFAAANSPASDPETTAAVPAAAPAHAPAGYALASVDSATLFSPYPTYSASSSPSATPAAPVAANDAQAERPAVNLPPAKASTASAPTGREALPPWLANADDEVPVGALAYAAPAADDAPASQAGPTTPTPPKRPSAAAHPATSSNTVLNSAQIASIKERLKLSSYQNQLWPPVESALHDISWQRDPSGRKSGPRAGIDPNSPPVQRLKSAAVPLIMSLSEEQKDEVRSMVRLMGLENLAAQF